MAYICPHCKSADTQAEINTVFCLNCGKRTPMKEMQPPPPPAG